MQPISRIKQSMYEASIRDVDKNLFEYLNKNFFSFLKEYRLAKYPIAVVFFTYLYLCFPSLKNRIFDKQLWKGLPFAFDIDSVEDITDGNTKLILKLTLANGVNYAIKIHKRTIGMDLNNLDKIMLDDICEHDEVSSWYQDLELVHKTFFLMINTAFNSQSALASIQEYIPHKMVDIFDYMKSPQQLFDLLTFYPAIAEKLYNFAERTLSIYESRRMCMDIVGTKNIALIFDEINGLDLKILDTESIIFFSKNGTFEGPDVFSVLRKLDFLKTIVEHYSVTQSEMEA